MSDGNSLKQFLEQKFGPVSDPTTFPPLSAISALWATGKTALAEAVRRTYPRDHPASRFSRDPDDLPSQTTLSNGETLRICVFDDMRFNAVATSWKNTSIAGIFHGMALVLPEAATHFWANPQIAPWIGDTSQLPMPNAHPEVPIGLQHMHWIVTGDIDGAYARGETHRYRDQTLVLHRSMCPVRRAAVAFTVNSGFRFLWSHEFAHIIFGHVAGLQRDFGVSAYSEALGVLDQVAIPSLHSQLVEYQADYIALTATVGGSFERFDVEYKAGLADQPIPTGEANTPLTPHQHALVAAIGCVMVPLIFHAQNSFAKRTEVVTTHPPLWFRAVMALEAMQSAMTMNPHAPQWFDELSEMLNIFATSHPVYADWYGGFHGYAQNELYSQAQNYLQQLDGVRNQRGERPEFPHKVHPSRLR